MFLLKLPSTGFTHCHSILTALLLISEPTSQQQTLMESIDLTTFFIILKRLI